MTHGSRCKAQQTLDFSFYVTLDCTLAELESYVDLMLSDALALKQDSHAARAHTALVGALNDRLRLARIELEEDFNRRQVEAA